MRYRRLKIPGASYFFTLVTHGRQKLFADAEVVTLLDAAIERVKMRHPFEIEAQVVLPDHLHALWQLPPDDAEYATRWRLIKEGFTKAFVKRHVSAERDAARRARGERSIWQRRYWEHLIRDDHDFGNHLDYIHLNPVNHGLVKAPRDWPHSTFADWVSRGVYEPNWGSYAKPELPGWAKSME